MSNSRFILDNRKHNLVIDREEEKTNIISDKTKYIRTMLNMSDEDLNCQYNNFLSDYKDIILDRIKSGIHRIQQNISYGDVEFEVITRNTTEYCIYVKSIANEELIKEEQTLYAYLMKRFCFDFNKQNHKDYISWNIQYSSSLKRKTTKGLEIQLSFMLFLIEE